MMICYYSNIASVPTCSKCTLQRHELASGGMSHCQRDRVDKSSREGFIYGERTGVERSIEQHRHWYFSGNKSYNRVISPTIE